MWKIWTSLCERDRKNREEMGRERMREEGGSIFRRNTFQNKLKASTWIWRRKKNPRYLRRRDLQRKKLCMWRQRSNARKILLGRWKSHPLPRETKHVLRWLVSHAIVVLIPFTVNCQSLQMSFCFFGRGIFKRSQPQLVSCHNSNIMHRSLTVCCLLLCIATQNKITGGKKKNQMK